MHPSPCISEEWQLFVLFVPIKYTGKLFARTGFLCLFLDLALNNVRARLTVKTGLWGNIHVADNEEEVFRVLLWLQPCCEPCPELSSPLIIWRPINAHDMGHPVFMREANVNGIQV